MGNIIDRLALAIDNTLLNIKLRAMRSRLTSYPNIHDTARIGPDVRLIGPLDAFVIGKNSYINDAIIFTGEHSKVTIGSHCAIGYRVSIKAVAHDVNNPCPKDDGDISIVERDINIGDYCWIGDNVFIKEGVNIGNNVVVGANSVVTKSFPDNVIVAGVPARVIRTNTSSEV